jgi:signal peptidase I
VASDSLAPVPRERAPGPAPVRHLGRLLARVAVWAAIGLGLGLALAVFGPTVAGYHSFTVLSGSMVPALQVGDLVVDEPLAPLDIRPGDVITFPDPEHGGRLITHRARGIRVHGTTVEVTTKGDANNSMEEWSIAATGRVGRVVYRLPWLGYVLVSARSRPGRIGLLVLPALALGLLGVRAIWRPRTAARAG